MRIRLTVALFIAGALATSGCGFIAEQASERLAEEAIEQGAGGDVDINLDDEDGGFSVESSDGSFQIGAGSRLPDDFPDDFPLPGDYEVVSSITSSNDNGSGFQVTLTTTDDFASLREAIERGLDDGGWEIEGTSEFNQGDSSNVSYQVTDGTRSGAIMLLRNDSEVTVSYTLGM